MRIGIGLLSVQEKRLKTWYFELVLQVKMVIRLEDVSQLTLKCTIVVRTFWYRDS